MHRQKSTACKPPVDSTPFLLQKKLCRDEKRGTLKNFCKQTVHRGDQPALETVDNGSSWWIVKSALNAKKIKTMLASHQSKSTGGEKKNSFFSTAGGFLSTVRAVALSMLKKNFRLLFK
uniref:Uncharacterized protein n=1 Tax=Cacopsylla melanoneura TaxID=428564 RepID=A0A8D8WLQ5_9HEMI